MEVSEVRRGKLQAYRIKVCTGVAGKEIEITFTSYPIFMFRRVTQMRSEKGVIRIPRWQGPIFWVRTGALERPENTIKSEYERHLYGGKYEPCASFSDM